MQSASMTSVLGQRIPGAACSRVSAAAGRSAARRSFALVVRAEGQQVAPPKGVTLPARPPAVPPPRFGFVGFAEKMNSRAAMIGFFALLAVEGIAGRPILEMLGFQLGQGINIGF